MIVKLPVRQKLCIEETPHLATQGDRLVSELETGTQSTLELQLRPCRTTS